MNSNNKKRKVNDSLKKQQQHIIVVLCQVPFKTYNTRHAKCMHADRRGQTNETQTD